MDPKTEAWRKAAHDIITELAATNTLIVSDMVVAALEQAGMGLNNYSALGGVFTRAAKAGLIIKTDETQPGNRKSHSAKTVWRSLTYKKATADVSPELEAISAMITNALGYNAAIIRNASIVFAAGPLKQSELKRQIKEFTKIADEYNAQHIKIIEHLDKRAGANQ